MYTRVAHASRAARLPSLETPSLVKLLESTPLSARAPCIFLILLYRIIRRRAREESRGHHLHYHRLDPILDDEIIAGVSKAVSCQPRIQRNLTIDRKTIARGSRIERLPEKPCTVFPARAVFSHV